MDNIVYIQGDEASTLTPLFLIHAVSGLALPYLRLGPLTDNDDPDSEGRPVYGLNSPIYHAQDHRLPRSLDDIARHYITIIQRETQRKGPYLLGGWSLGGMIALKMASILEAWGESVIHVIMIDSLNPESYPAFIDRAEHDKITALTYNSVVGRMNVPEPPIDETDSSASDYSDDDDEHSLASLLRRMRKHISNSLYMLSSASGKPFLPERCSAPVTLIKCSLLSQPSPALREARKHFVRKVFHEERMGWPLTKFGRFRTIPFAAQHDSVFDEKHTRELTRILKGVLARVP
ncbi:MAG: hypothetical protein L6R37_002829 [Teloschistes peruensis]|nr:MAG: hypothetical protein L6R37_002829 [Teloschistes peruensis]